MTDKALEAALDPMALEAAREAFYGGPAEAFKNPPVGALAVAISAYLSALPGEAEVVAWRWKMLKDKTWTYDPAEWFVDKNKSDPSMVFDPLVTLASLQSMQARAEAAEARVKELEEALREAEELIGLSEHPAFPDPAYHEEVKTLGRRIGFGALMSTASAGWREVIEEKGMPNGSEFVAGSCFGSVQRTLGIVRTALKGGSNG